MNILEFLKERKKILKGSAIALIAAVVIYILPVYMASAILNDTYTGGSVVYSQGEVINPENDEIVSLPSVNVTYRDQNDVDTNPADEMAVINAENSSEQSETKTEYISESVSVNGGKQSLSCYGSDSSFTLSLSEDGEKESCAFDVNGEFDCRSFLSETADKLVQSGDTFPLKDFVRANPNFILKEIYVRGKGRLSLEKHSYDEDWAFSLKNDDGLEEETYIFGVSEGFDSKGFLNEAANKLFDSDEIFSLKYFVSVNPNLILKEIYVRGKGRISLNKNSYDENWSLSLNNYDYSNEETCIFNANKDFDCRSFLNEAADELMKLGDDFSLKVFVSENPNLSLKGMYEKKGKLSLEKRSYDEYWTLSLKNDDWLDKETYTFNVREGFDSKRFLNEVANKLFDSDEIFSLKDFVSANPNLILQEIYVRGKGRLSLEKHSYDENWSLSLKNDDCLEEETYTFNVSESFDFNSFLNVAVNNIKIKLSEFLTLKDFMSSYPGLSIKEYARGEKTFIEGGITYNIVDCDKVSVIAVDKTLEILDFDKPVIHNGNAYEVIRIKRKDDRFEPILYGSNVKEINLPSKGIDIDCLLFFGARELRIIKNLNKAHMQLMENEWYIDRNSLFFDCINLSAVDLPEILTKIRKKMLFNCKSLRTITIGKNVSEIEEDAFFGCCNLESVIFEEGSKLSKIGKGAFCGCKKLKDCKIPKSVREIGDYAFSACESLDLIALDPEVKVGLYSFPDGKMVGVEVQRDETLVISCEKIQKFTDKILSEEISQGRDVKRLVMLADIDKLLYEYNTGSTDKPTVVGKDDFKKIIKDRKYIFYRGVTRPDKSIGESAHARIDRSSEIDKFPTAKSVSDNFKEGEFYYTAEYDGIYCTPNVDTAKFYAKDEGTILWFCFLDENATSMIKSLELMRISDFCKYFNVEKYIDYEENASDFFAECSFELERFLWAHCAGFYHLRYRVTFPARALGYDVVDSVSYNPLYDGSSNEYQVVNRKKLLICEEDIAPRTSA